MASHKLILSLQLFPPILRLTGFFSFFWSQMKFHQLRGTHPNIPRLPWTSFCLLFSLVQIIAHDNLFLAFLSLLEHKPFESLNWVWLQCLEQSLTKKRLSDVHVIVTACDARSGHLNISHIDARQDLRVQQIMKNHHNHQVQVQVRRENSGK